MSEAKFLVLHEGEIEEPFKTILAQRGKVVRSRDEKPHSFDLLVLHCGSIHHKSFEKAAETARAALEANKPVLVLGPTDQHKSMLAKAGALYHYAMGESAALLIEPQRGLHDELHLVLAEQHHPTSMKQGMTRTLAAGAPEGEIEFGPVDELPAGEAPTLTAADLDRFVERVSTAVINLQNGIVFYNPKSGGGPTPPPGNIPPSLYDVTLYTQYRTVYPTGAPSDGFQPPQGRLTLEGTVYLGVYYDNVNFNTPAQWLIVEFSGHYSTYGMEADTSTNRGWSLARFEVLGHDISGPQLVSRQSSPNNVNGSRDYSSSTSFTVGLSRNKNDGVTVDASYTVSSSTTQTITDWAIQQLSPNRWDFYQQVPYDGRIGGKFPDGAAGSNGVSSLPAISRGALAYNTQTVWIRNPATNVDSNVGYDQHMTFCFTHSYSTGKSWKAANWRGWWTESPRFVIAWRKAWPTAARAGAVAS